MSPWNYLWLTSSAGQLGIRAFDFSQLDTKKNLFLKVILQNKILWSERREGIVFKLTGGQIAPGSIYIMTIIFKNIFLSIAASHSPRQQFSRYQPQILGKNIIWSVTKNSRGKWPEASNYNLLMPLYYFVSTYCIKSLYLTPVQGEILLLFSYSNFKSPVHILHDLCSWIGSKERNHLSEFN